MNVLWLSCYELSTVAVYFMQNSMQACNMLNAVLLFFLMSMPCVVDLQMEQLESLLL